MTFSSSLASLLMTRVNQLFLQEMNGIGPTLEQSQWMKSTTRLSLLKFWTLILTIGQLLVKARQWETVLKQRLNFISSLRTVLSPHLINSSITSISDTFSRLFMALLKLSQAIWVASIILVNCGFMRPGELSAIGYVITMTQKWSIKRSDKLPRNISNQVLTSIRRFQANHSSHGLTKAPRAYTLKLYTLMKQLII